MLVLMSLLSRRSCSGCLADPVSAGVWPFVFRSYGCFVLAMVPAILRAV